MQFSRRQMLKSREARANASASTLCADCCNLERTQGNSVSTCVQHMTSMSRLMQCYNSIEEDKERTVSSLLIITRLTRDPHQTDSSTPCSSIHHCVASSANNNSCTEVSHDGSFDSKVMMFCVGVPVLLEHNMSIPASSSVDANRDTMFQPDFLDIRTCSLELLSNCNHTLLVQLSVSVCVQRLSFDLAGDQSGSNSL